MRTRRRSVERTRRCWLPANASPRTRPTTRSLSPSDAPAVGSKRSRDVEDVNEEIFDVTKIPGYPLRKDSPDDATHKTREDNWWRAQPNEFLEKHDTRRYKNRLNADAKRRSAAEKKSKSAKQNHSDEEAESDHEHRRPAKKAKTAGRSPVKAKNTSRRSVSPPARAAAASPKRKAQSIKRSKVVVREADESADDGSDNDMKDSSEEEEEEEDSSHRRRVAKPSKKHDSDEEEEEEEEDHDDGEHAASNDEESTFEDGGEPM
jgi:hypothetical protein